MFLRYPFCPTLPFVVLCTLLLGTKAQSMPSSWTDANQAMVDQHIIPGYLRLQKSTQALSGQSQQFCARQNQAGFNALRNAYQQAMDDWMAMQPVRLGPVGMLLRYNRYQLWPDKHGTGAKQLHRLLAAQDNDGLQAERFMRSSVAIQGFTALERLLFPKQPKLADFSAQGAASYRCKLVNAITRNLADMSREIVHDWQGGEVNYRKTVLTADNTNAYYNSAKDVSGVLLNDLHTQLQSIVDQKLMRPMQHYRMQRAESWRSRRSLRNIIINLQACKALYGLGFTAQVSDKPLQQKINRAFAQSIAAARAIKIPLYDIRKDSPEAAQLVGLLAETRQLKHLLATELPDAIGLVLGFNSLDGD